MSSAVALLLSLRLVVAAHDSGTPSALADAEAAFSRFLAVEIAPMADQAAFKRSFADKRRALDAALALFAPHIAVAHSRAAALCRSGEATLVLADALRATAPPPSFDAQQREMLQGELDGVAAPVRARALDFFAQCAKERADFVWATRCEDRLKAMSKTRARPTGAGPSQSPAVATTAGAPPPFGPPSEFLDAEAAFARFDAIRIEAPDQPRAFKDSLQLKRKAHDEVVALFQPHASVAAERAAALCRIGEAKLALARAIEGAPPPRGLTEEQQAMFRGKLREQAEPVEAGAVSAFASCASEKGAWAERCAAHLAALKR